MSDLHFDAEGEPARVPADADELRVRRFRKPGERGACEVVHGADGAPLYVPVDITYPEFRKVVDGLPGRYRLDPVDAGRRPCSGAVPLYVTIETPRQAPGAGDDRESVLRELVRANVEMMRANVEMTKNVTDRLATMMTATAEILRAADGAGLPRREPPPPAPERENDPDDDPEEDDDDQDDAPAMHPLTEVVAHFMKQATPLLELYLAEKMSARRPAPAPAASTPATSTASPAAPASPPAAAPEATPPAPTTTAPDAAPDAAPAAPAAPAAAPAEVRNGAPPAAPTPEQLQHLIAIKARLSPLEQRVVMTALPQMDPAARAHWLTELCALPVDDAAALLRSMMPPLRDEPADVPAKQPPDPPPAPPPPAASSPPASTRRDKEPTP